MWMWMAVCVCGCECGRECILWNVDVNAGRCMCMMVC